MADTYFTEQTRKTLHDLQTGKQTLVEMLQYRMMVCIDREFVVSPTTIKTMKDVVEDMQKFRHYFKGLEKEPMVMCLMIELNLDPDFFERIDIFIATVVDIVKRDINTYNERVKQQRAWW